MTTTASYRGVECDHIDDARFQALSPMARLLDLLLRVSPERGAAGLFRFSPALLMARMFPAADPIEGPSKGHRRAFREAFEELRRAGFVVEEDGFVFLPGVLTAEPNFKPRSDRKHYTALVRQLTAARHLTITRRLFEEHGLEWPEDWPTEALRRAIEGPSKAPGDSDSDTDTDSDTVPEPPPAVAGSARAPRKPRRSDPTTKGFTEFWERYPRAEGKARASAAWSKLTPEERAAAAAGLGPWVEYWQARNEPQYTPHAATWLNDRRWTKAPPARRPSNPAAYVGGHPEPTAPSTGPSAEDGFAAILNAYRGAVGTAARTVDGSPAFARALEAIDHISADRKAQIGERSSRLFAIDDELLDEIASDEERALPTATHRRRAVRERLGLVNPAMEVGP